MKIEALQLSPSALPDRLDPTRGVDMERETPYVQLSRRDLLRGGAAFLTTASVAGCSLLKTEPEGRASAGPAVAKGKEAPAMVSSVAAGKLPPLDQRLPAKPVVVQPVNRIGVYGGQWRTALLGPADTYWLDRTVGYEPMLRWDPAFERILPNVAEHYELSADARQVTFRLRKGMKWSDGTPFTVDDVLFAQNDVYADPALYPEQEGDPGRAEKVDDVTVRISFQEPNGLYLPQHAGVDVTAPPLVRMPKHYLQQFHKKHNPDADALAKKAGFQTWVELFLSRSGPWENPERPTLNPWLQKNRLGDRQLVFERNPYYFKTDPDGSQLPYIDTVRFEIIAEPQVMMARALQGNIDMHARHFTELANKPVLAEGRKRGGYKLFALLDEGMNSLVIALNLAHADPAKRELFNKKDFRIGLSHAIDRAEIITAVYHRQGQPWQAAPRPESVYYDEAFAKQYTEYNVQLANEHLDKAGLTSRDGSGRRLGPNGKPIEFTIEFAHGRSPDWPAALQFVQRYWKAVGVSINLRPEDRSLFETRLAGNKHDAAIWKGDGGLQWEVLMRPYWYLPLHDYSIYGPPWAQWKDTGGTAGQRPPDWVIKQLEVYDQVKATADPAKQVELMRQVLQIAKDQFHVMGINLTPDGFGIVKNNFNNVPDKMPLATLYPTPGPTHPEQFFIS